MRPTVILSDLHLGRPHGAAVGADALSPLWANTERLVINGDTAEVHHPAHRSVAARETLRLAELCEDDGVELILLSGNHDPYISDRRHLSLGGGAIFVTHGDVVHPAVAPWSPAAARMREARAVAERSLDDDVRGSLEAWLSVSQHAAYREWDDVRELEREAARSTLLGMLTRPWAVAQVLRYWQEFPRLAGAFVAEHAPEARFGVFGHTHRAGIWRLDGRTIINTGSFGIPGRPHAVLIEDGELRFARVVRRGAVYAYAARTVKQFGLPRPVRGRSDSPFPMSR